MVAKKIIVSDEICNDDGSFVNPNASVSEEGEHILPPGLAPVARPKTSKDDAYNLAIYQFARDVRRKNPEQWAPALIHQLITAPTPEQEKILKKYRDAAKVPTAAIRGSRATAAKGQSVKPTRPAQPATQARAKAKPRLQQASRSSKQSGIDSFQFASVTVAGQEIDDFLMETEQMRPSARPARGKPAAAPKQSGLAGLRASIAARVPRAPAIPPLSEAFGIERLSVETADPVGLLTITAESSQLQVQLPYHWVIPSKEAFTVVVDTRADGCDLLLDAERFDGSGRLFLEFEEPAEELFSTTAMDTVYQFDWGVFRFIQFLLTD